MDLTLRDNLAIKTFDREPFAKKGVLQPEAFEQQATDLIERYDIRSGQGSQTMTRSMSGGNQQKAIIAREVELDSDLLIFVQPTRGLDVGAIANIHQQILEQRDKGKAVLLVSLELDEVLALADTICVAFRGQILKTDSAKNLSKEEVGQYMMGGNAMKKFITRVRSALSGLLVPSISIALTLIVASVIVLLLGKNPLEVFLGFLRGSGLVFKPRYAGGQGILTDFFSYLSILTPMIFASLGVMMGLRAGLFNIGVAGQMLLPGFLASVFVGYSDLPTYLAWRSLSSSAWWRVAPWEL